MNKHYLAVGSLMFLASCAQAPPRSVVAQQVIAPAAMKSEECATPSPSVIASQPSFDSVQSVMKGLQPSTEIPTPPNKYRTYAKILVILDSNGLIQDARIPLVVRGADGKFERADGGYMSTGNRDVDKALLAWAHGIKFNAVQCSAGKYRFASIQINLQ